MFMLEACEGRNHFIRIDRGMLGMHQQAVFAALGAAVDVKGDGDLVIVDLGHAASSLRQFKGLCDQISQDWH